MVVVVVVVRSALLCVARGMSTSFPNGVAVGGVWGRSRLRSAGLWVVVAVVAPPPPPICGKGIRIPLNEALLEKWRFADSGTAKRVVLRLPLGEEGEEVWVGVGVGVAVAVGRHGGRGAGGGMGDRRCCSSGEAVEGVGLMEGGWVPASWGPPPLPLRPPPLLLLLPRLAVRHSGWEEEEEEEVTEGMGKEGGVRPKEGGMAYCPFPLPQCIAVGCVVVVVVGMVDGGVV